MPSPLNGLTSATLSDLSIGSTDMIKLQLLLEKTAGNASQTVNLSTFATKYNTTDDKVSSAIRALETAEAIRSNYGTLTLNWMVTPTASTTAAQLQSDWNSGVLDDYTYYVYQALILNKGASATQNVDPGVYSASPWNIPTAKLIAEIQALAARKPSNTKPNNIAPFTADFATVTLTWLTANIGNAA